MNKTGSVGIGLFPMILVAQGVGAASSAWIMGMAQAAAFAGAFFGGWLTDRIGARRTLLAVFVVSAAALGAVPWVSGLPALALAAILAYGANAAYPGATRLLLTQAVVSDRRQLALGWLRTVNNGAQILSFTFIRALRGVGLPAFFLLDALSSLAAAVYARGALVDLESNPGPAPGAERRPSPARSSGFWLAALVAGTGGCLYELFTVSCAARFRIDFGEAGAQRYAEIFFWNTLLCALLSVAVSSRLRNPFRAIPTGLILMASGMMLLFRTGASWTEILLAMLVITAGELVFNAVAGFLVLETLPEGSRQGSVFGVAQLIQFAMRALGGAMAFPLVVNASMPLIPFVALTFLGLTLCWGLRWERQQVPSVPLELDDPSNSTRD